MRSTIVIETIGTTFFGNKHNRRNVNVVAIRNIKLKKNIEFVVSLVLVLNMAAGTSFMISFYSGIPVYDSTIRNNNIQWRLQRRFLLAVCLQSSARSEFTGTHPAELNILFWSGSTTTFVTNEETHRRSSNHRPSSGVHKFPIPTKSGNYVQYKEYKYDRSIFVFNLVGLFVECYIRNRTILKSIRFE